jgi:hypothetical protein
MATGSSVTICELFQGNEERGARPLQNAQKILGSRLAQFSLISFPFCAFDGVHIMRSTGLYE